MAYHNSEATAPNHIPSTEDSTSLSNTFSVYDTNKDTKDNGDLLATYTDTFHELPTSPSPRTSVFDSLPDNFEHNVDFQALITILTSHQSDSPSALGAIKNLTVALSTNGEYTHCSKAYQVIPETKQSSTPRYNSYWTMTSLKYLLLSPL